MDLKRIKAAKRGLETSDLCLEKHLAISSKFKNVSSLLCRRHIFAFGFLPQMYIPGLCRRLALSRATCLRPATNISE